MQLAYKPGDSLFHKVDPLTKFLWVLLVAFWLYSLREITAVLAVSLGIAAFAIAVARLELRSYIRFVGLIFFASSFLIVYQGLLRPGSGVRIGSIVLSYSGMELGLAIGLRTFGLVASSLAFSVTTSPQDFELSLVKIGLSYKISHICYLSLRLLPVFQNDLLVIQDVQKIRNAKGGWNKVRTSIVALIATELRMVDNIAIALETRGFGLHDTRTELTEVQISRTGIILVIGTLVLIALQLLYS